MSVASPRISVIVPHFNYARYAGSAMLSVIHQSLEDWELIVVDDKSSATDLAKLEDIVSELNDPRIALLRNHENQGQIGTIFRGLQQARGEFITVLDPDDLYEPLFLETMLAALLNDTHTVGLAACEMGVFDDRCGVVSLHSTDFRMRAVTEGRHEQVVASQLLKGYGAYLPPWQTGWHWATTSGMMFRRSLLTALTPQKPISLTRFHGDSYCAFGCHIIAGTVFVDEMLSWRRVHDMNTAKNPVTVLNSQIRLKPDFEDTLWDVTLLVAETILANPALAGSARSSIVSAAVAHLGYEGLSVVSERNAAVKDALFQYSFGGI